MRDFTDLESMVRDTESRRYFHEATVALSAGANRAALVSLWTAVVLDLMGKVRRMAETGDGEARVISEEIDRAISSKNTRNMQYVEFNLLANAEKMEIVSPRQKEELERVRDDRNICAHPAFVAKGEVFSPSIELVRSHMATAVDCCLSLPAISGKQVIQLFEDDLASDAWPEITDVTSFVRHRYLENVRESTRRNITKIALKYALAPDIAKVADEIEPHVVAYRSRCYINAVAVIDRNLLESCLRTVLDGRRKQTALDGECLLRSLGAFGHFHEYWEYLREDEVIALDRLLTNSNAEELLEQEVFASGVPMNERVAATFRNAFDRASSCNSGNVDRLLSSATYGWKTLVPLVVSNLRSAYSYRDAEQRLSRVNGLANYLTVEDIAEIGRAVRSNNQIYEAAGTQTLLINIFERTKNVAGAIHVWEEFASDMNGDYLERHPESPDGYYSYSQLLTLVSETKS